MDVIDIDPNDDDGADSGLGALIGEHPLALLGAALTLGYLVGGGLGTRASRRLLRMGVSLGFQLSSLPDLEDEIAGLASRLGQTLRGAAESHVESDDFAEESAEIEQKEL